MQLYRQRLCYPKLFLQIKSACFFMSALTKEHSDPKLAVLHAFTRFIHKKEHFPFCKGLQKLTFPSLSMTPPPPFPPKEKKKWKIQDIPICNS